MALVFARTETHGFHRQAWEKAQGMMFFEGRIHFHHLDGRRAKGNCGGPSVLIAYGKGNCQRLQACSLPGKYISVQESL